MKKEVSLADVKVGDEVEVFERYPEAVITTCGRVTRRCPDMDIHFGDAVVVLAKHARRQAFRVLVEQADPPAVRCALVKYYDPNYLRLSVARHDGETGWYDLDNGGPVELDSKEWTVLFDPRKDS